MALGVHCIAETVADNISGDEHKGTYQSTSYSKDNNTLKGHVCLAHQSTYFLNISSDATLSSIISLSGLHDIAVSGHNNLTVTCMNDGGLHFDSCHNCKIEGIN